MTKHEREALLGYLEFNLTSMVEQYEITLGKTLDPEMLDAITGDLYDGAYEVLNEMERSLTEILQDSLTV